MLDHLCGVLDALSCKEKTYCNRDGLDSDLFGLIGLFEAAIDGPESAAAQFFVHNNILINLFSGPVLSHAI